MAHIPRQAETQLAALLHGPIKETGAILVEGARQVGKTTLVRTVLENADGPVAAVDLEDRTLLRSRIDACDEFGDFEHLLVDELGFRPADGGVLFIDEAQESLRLGRFVRYMKERWSEPRVVLTGSTLSRLFRADTRYPVGRVSRLHLRPLTFPEFLLACGETSLADLCTGDPGAISAARHRALLGHLDAYLDIGGMPRIVLDHAEGLDYVRRRSELLADLRNDFLRLFDENEIDIVMSCFRSVANFVGSPSKLSTVAMDSHTRITETARRIFARLEAWGLVLRSAQRGPAPESSHRFHPKRYLFDTGILRHLRETAVPTIDIINTIDNAQRAPLGGVIENQVAIALQHEIGALCGWKRSSSGGEIDFIAPGPLPIECKAALDLMKTHLKGLRAYMDDFAVRTGIVVSLAPYAEFEIDGRRIVNVPLYRVDEAAAALARA